MGQASVRDRADFHVGGYFRATGNSECDTMTPVGTPELMLII